MAKVIGALAILGILALAAPNVQAQTSGLEDIDGDGIIDSWASITPTTVQIGLDEACGREYSNSYIFSGLPETAYWVQGEAPTGAWTIVSLQYSAVAQLLTCSWSSDDNCEKFWSYRLVTLGKPFFSTETVATLPQDRTRKTVGVGEPVVITIQPASITQVAWTISGSGTFGTLNATTGRTVTFTAGDRAATTTIKATYNGGPLNISVDFTTIEPSGVVIDQEVGTGVRHTFNFASCGFQGRPYITPSNVSFENVSVREGSTSGIGTGYLGVKNGQPHSSGSWVGVDEVVTGKGSFVMGVDTISSGDYGWTPYSSGMFTWNIPWFFKVGTGAEKEFTVVTHQETTDATGRLTISKGGTTKSAGLTDPTSGF